ncbi:MAG TPA: hypothetical protein VFT75_00970 [Nocardioidaceae bacterium]|nr:hypothetical protein [Nocardioidaceae bacterium]
MTDIGELERLRARVAELEGELQEAQTPPEARRHRIRAGFAALLIVLGCVLAPFSVVSVWASTQMSNTDRWVATVEPLVHDPAVQSAIADNVTVAILDKVDVHTLATQALSTLADRPNVPPRLAAVLPGLAVPITNGVEGFIGTQVDKAVASPAFATVWDQANRVAHQNLVNLLEGNQNGALTAQNGEVTLNLAPIIAQVKQRLVARGFTPAAQIPAVDKSFVLVKSDAVTKAQGLYRLLNTMGIWLPIITLALLAGGIALARRHLRALGVAAFGVAGSMLVLGVALAVARVLYLNAVPSDVLPAQAAGDVYDTLIRFLRYSLRSVAAVGLVVGLGAYLTGPGSGAVRTRAAFSRGIGGLRGGAERAGMQTGVVGTWTFAHKRWLRIGAVVLGAVVLVLWSQPNVPVILTITGLVLLALAVIEFLGRPPTPAAVVLGGPAEPRVPLQPTGTERAPQGAPHPDDEEPVGEHKKSEVSPR